MDPRLFKAIGQTHSGRNIDEHECLINKNILKGENYEEKKLDEILSLLGECWYLFKHEDYENSFPSIYLLALQGVPQADYLIGKFYEYGLGIIYKSAKDASSFYAKTILDSQERDLNLLEIKAEEGFKRTLSAL